MKIFVVMLVAAILSSAFIVGGNSPQDPVKKNPSPIPDKAEVSPNAENASDNEFSPVDDMHHFMENAWQPSFKALKELLKSEPENRRIWRDIKTHAMLLAELSTVVATRVPDNSDEVKTKLWREISAEVNNHGKELYAASGKFEKAKAAYGKMIDSCNRCHNEFEDGKHLLEK